MTDVDRINRVRAALRESQSFVTPGGLLYWPALDDFNALLAACAERLKAVEQERDDAHAIIAADESLNAAIRAAETFKAQAAACAERGETLEAALRELGEYNEGEPCWCPSWWWDSETGGKLSSEHSSSCAAARAAIAGAAPEPERGS